MEKQNPFFSVLLPTYNRAAFLPMAIESILAQTFADFELVISDGGSTDDTKATVLSHDDSRVKYVQSSERLSMGQNYQKAFDYSTGDFVVFFSDDDAFWPTALAKLASVIQTHDSKMVVFPYARYYHDDDNEFQRNIMKNSVLFFPFSCDISEKTGRDELVWLFGSFGLIKERRVQTSAQPFIGNCAIARSIFETIGEKTKDLFPNVPIDVSFITLVLGVVETFHVLDEPLLVWSRWNQNSTPSAKLKGTLARQHFEKLLDGRPLEHSPFKFALPFNCSANAILQAREILGEKVSYIEIDWGSFFVWMFEYLSSLEDSGVDVRKEIEEFDNVLSMQSDKIQWGVERHGSNFLRHGLKKKLRRILPAGVQRIAKAIASGRARQPVIINGKGKFTNFLECAQYLEQSADDLKV